MARSPSFKVRKLEAGGYMVAVPASVSDTGAFRRRYFKTRDKAYAEAKRLREVWDGKRDRATLIRPALADDAVEAAKLLAPFGASLKQAAQFYVSHHDLRAAAPSLENAWSRAITMRPHHRARTLEDYRAWKKALPGDFMALNVRDITAELIRGALDRVTKGATRWDTGLRYIRAVLSDCEKLGEVDENPAKRVHVVRKPESESDVTLYSPEQLKSLLEACRDYDEGLDKKCQDCASAFALMAFAGIRPDEVAKLRWDDIQFELDNIRIGPSIAKKARRRNVRLQPTLKAWLERVPADERNGPVVPTRWRQKAARVRREAGIDGHAMQDALRHSFGTYLLAVEGDLQALQQDMGHEHVRVFFEHYRKALTKAQALPYWDVLPPENAGGDGI